MSDLNEEKVSGTALLPLILFVVSYLGTGIALTMKGVDMAFYAVKAPIFVILGIIFAFILFHKNGFAKNLEDLLAGCGDDNIVIMCMIYLLAGAFSTVSKSIGAVDSVVNLSLSVIPVEYITAGIFVISAFIATATGSSVGTVVALGTIAVGVAEKGNLNMAMVLGALVGGAMAGDNLSIISDTTIAATRTQNVRNKDKFLMNFKITIPAAIITIILLLIFGRPESAVSLEQLDYSLIKVVPYLFVLISAIMGMDVFLVLTLGTLIAGGIGLAQGAFESGLITLADYVYEGFNGMFEIFLLSLLTGGLAHMVRKNGGINWIIEKMRKNISDNRSAELSVAGLTAITDAALANNTVSIVINGPIAKRLSNEFKVDPRRMASLLDMFSCIVQGIIPYGAQLLIVAGFTEGQVSPVQVVPFVWYNFILAAMAIVSIYVRFSDAKEPWDYELDQVAEAN